MGGTKNGVMKGACLARFVTFLRPQERQTLITFPISTMLSNP